MNSYLFAYLQHGLLIDIMKKRYYPAESASDAINDPEEGKLFFSIQKISGCKVTKFLWIFTVADYENLAISDNIMVNRSESQTACRRTVLISIASCCNNF